jgi:hypothetical protein
VAGGTKDPDTPRSENRRLARLIPGSRYKEIANARHFPNVERPEAARWVGSARSASALTTRRVRTGREWGENNENHTFCNRTDAIAAYDRLYLNRLWVKFVS